MRLYGVLVARIKRLELSLMGDVQPVGEGVSELRIHLGAGWRLHFTQRGQRIIVLLAGGPKRTQNKDIKRAKALAAEWRNDHDETHQGGRSARVRRGPSSRQ